MNQAIHSSVGPAMHQDALALMTRIAAGDEKAMKQFFDQHADTIYRYVLTRCSEESIAAEILNEVMLDVWRKPHTYEGRAKISTWLIGIARHKLLDHYRRNKRHDADELDDAMEDDSPTAACAINAQQHANYLHECLDKLTSNHKEIVHLAFFEDMAYPEIAEIAKLPVGTIKSRIFHAKEKLRQCVQRLTQGEIANEYA